MAEAAQGLDADAPPARGAQPARGGLVGQAAEAVAVAGEAGPVPLGAGDHALPRRGVDLVHVRADGGETAREQGLLDAARGGGEVAQGGEPAEGLPQQRPARKVQRLAQQLGVRDDRVGAEEGEIAGLLGGARLAQGAGARDRALGQRGVGADGGGAAGAALVEHEHAVLAQGARQPGRGGGVQWSRSLGAGPALEVDEDGEVLAAGPGDEAGEELDRGPGGVGMVQRDGEGEVGEREARQGPVGACGAGGLSGHRDSWGSRRRGWWCRGSTPSRSGAGGRGGRRARRRGPRPPRTGARRRRRRRSS